jgi:hypothetical protein
MYEVEYALAALSTLPTITVQLSIVLVGNQIADPERWPAFQ